MSSGITWSGLTIEQTEGERIQPAMNKSGTVNGRYLRLAFGFLLPVLLVVVSMTLVTAIVQPGTTAQFLLMGIFFGYLYMGIPSLIYTIVMEYVVVRRLSSAAAAIAAGAALGFASGMAVWWTVLNDFGFAFLGLVSGGLTAWLLSAHFRRTNRR